MKKSTLTALLLCLLFAVGCSSDDSNGGDNTDDGGQNNTDDGTTVELTTIADPNFEQALIDLGFDDALDGTVRTSSIENVVDLVLNEKEISDLSGLEDFVNLENLWVQNNQLTEITVTPNTRLKFIFADGNDISELNVVGLADLEKIGMNGNQLTSIDVSRNTVLNLLEINDNQVTSLDVSANNDLFRLSVLNNPLSCIQVNPTQFADIPDEWEKDEEDVYALDCE